MIKKLTLFKNLFIFATSLIKPAIHMLQSKHEKLFIVILMLLSINVSAQNAEIGLGIGTSTNSVPFGTEFYRGNRVATNYAAGLTYVRNLGRIFQYGADLYVVELSRKSFYVYTWEDKQIGNNDKKFEYARASYSFCPVFNAKFFKFGKSYLYAGLSVGVVLATNYKTDDGTTPNSNISYVAPSGGIGEVGGAQAGINYNVTPRISINGQVAVRYYNLYYNTQADHYNDKLAYGTLVYPVIVGVRYNMGYTRHINAMNGKYELK
jgi:hypothetical protein